MLRNLVIGCLTIVGLAGAPMVLRGQQPTFSLGFASPPCGTTVEGGPGGAYAAVIDCTLTTSDNPSDEDGAQGWTISVGFDGALRIVGITTDGTTGADVDDGGLRDGGFDQTALTENGTGEKDDPRPTEGNEGAVSAVVLSFQLPITLPADGTSLIAKLDVEGTFPAEVETTENGRVFYVDGRQGSGQPVPNKVTWMSATVDPSLGECSVDLFAKAGPVECCDAPISLYFQQEAIVQVAEAFAAKIADCTDIDENNQHEVSGESTVIYVGINSNGLVNGAQGWSLGVATDGDVEFSDVTVEGGAGADVDDGGLRDGGFNSTELTSNRVEGCPGEDKEPPFDRRPCDNNEGAVSAIVLSFQLPITLETAGSAGALALTTIPLGVPTEEEAVAGTLEVRDGLQGAGQPVNTVVTINSATENFCFPPALDVSFIVPPVSDYVSGEVNADGRLDLADPIYLINAMLRGGPPVACPIAADANGDGSLGDVSDAIFIVMYLWLGGEPPVGSFPDCGGGADLPDTALCPAASNACP